MEEDDIELSPGFFDTHHNNEYEEDINNLIPERIIIESPAKKNNVLVDFLFLFFTTGTTSCGCDQERGWTRTTTY